MSDFDFDALRDPDAPLPGARERAAVDARARSLRARARLNRVALSSVSVVVVLALAVGMVASRHNDGEPQIIVAGGPTSTTVTATTTPTTAPTSTPVTATTTTPPPTQTPAVASATWVSPDHGWVLLEDGMVAETADGGSSWRVVGSVQIPDGTQPRIRFGDANNGYVFDTGESLFATADGGRSWYSLTVPFAGAADLAVWNGTVYAASYDTTNATVDVWTTSIGGSKWTKHPTGIPIGGGPVPQTQLVFSGGKGWLLQVDRTVVGGAQLTSSGDWTPWTPPCASANGPAWLAASTAVDLVVSCEEHTYGGGPVDSSIWFSHDGGQTFSRRAAPTSGAAATPKGRIAVVPGSAGIERTSDEGATWQGVFDAPFRASDLGFTTFAQGFVIFTNGEMVMTYDAGATWQRVTLP